MRRLMFSGAAVATVLLATTCQAAVLTGSYADWLVGAGSAITHTDVLGNEFDALATVSLAGGSSFTASFPGDVREIGSGWSTWSGSYAGHVLYNAQSVVTLSLSGVSAFGFEIEPYSNGPFDMSDITVTLSSRETLTQYVAGFGGAQFFGFYGGGVSSIDISVQDVAFAYGNFVSVPVSPVPLPAAAPLFGAAVLLLAGSGFAARRRSLQAGPGMMPDENCGHSPV